MPKAMNKTACNNCNLKYIIEHIMKNEWIKDASVFVEYIVHRVVFGNGLLLLDSSCIIKFFFFFFVQVR